MSYFYIASPYTHERFNIVHRRYLKVLNFTTFLLHTKKLMVYSPIVHSHHIFLHGEETKMEFDFWANLDRAMIEPSDGLIVFQISGWEQSVGVQSEIKIAEGLKKPIKYSTIEWPDYDHIY